MKKIGIDDDIAEAEAHIAEQRARVREAWDDSTAAMKDAITSPAALAGAVAVGFLVERRASRPRKREREPRQAPHAGFWGALTGIGLALVREQAKHAGGDFIKDILAGRRPEVRSAAQEAAHKAATEAAERASTASAPRAADHAAAAAAADRAAAEAAADRAAANASAAGDAASTARARAA